MALQWTLCRGSMSLYLIITLESELGIKRSIVLLLQRTWDQIPAPTLQLRVIPVPGDLPPSSGLCGHCSHVNKFTHKTYTQHFKNKIFRSRIIIQWLGMFFTICQYDFWKLIQIYLLVNNRCMLFWWALRINTESVFCQLYRLQSKIL